MTETETLAVMLRDAAFPDAVTWSLTHRSVRDRWLRVAAVAQAYAQGVVAEVSAKGNS